MSALEKAFAPTERMISAKRQQMLDAAIDYIRNGKDGSMRDRLRTASAASGVPIVELESKVGIIDRIKVTGK